jgi:hypothetical protein
LTERFPLLPLVTLTVAELLFDAPAVSVAVHPAWMVVGVGDDVWKDCPVPATNELEAGDRHWYV